MDTVPCMSSYCSQRRMALYPVTTGLAMSSRIKPSRHKWLFIFRAGPTQTGERESSGRLPAAREGRRS
jgi:hypothetical protein